MGYSANYSGTLIVGEGDDFEALPDGTVRLTFESFEKEFGEPEMFEAMAPWVADITFDAKGEVESGVVFVSGEDDPDYRRYVFFGGEMTEHGPSITWPTLPGQPATDEQASELTIELSDGCDWESVLTIGSWNLDIVRYDGTHVPARFIGVGRDEGDGYETVQYAELTESGEPAEDSTVEDMRIDQIERLVIY